MAPSENAGLSRATLSAKEAADLRSAIAIINRALVRCHDQEVVAHVNDSTVALQHFETRSQLRYVALQEPTGELEQACATAMRVLSGAVATDVDLTATDLEKEAAADLASILEFNQRIMVLRVAFNPALDSSAKAGLRAAAHKWHPNLFLDM